VIPKISTIARLSLYGWVLLLLLISISGHSQILLNNGHLFSDDPSFFNEEFIRKNKIRAIKGKIAEKRELKPIRQLGLVQEFFFDQQGRLKGQLETNKQTGGGKGKVLSTYEYDSKGRLKVWRGTDPDGFFSWSYNYDTDDRLAKKSYRRETSKSKDDGQFELDRQIEITSESYAYPYTSDKQTKRVYINGQGKPFKNIVSNFDEYGNLIEEEETYIVTKRRTRYSYEYDDFQRLAIKRETPSGNVGNTMEYRYRYDAYGNVEEEKIYRNGDLTLEREWLYDKATLLLSAMLIKDVGTGTIRIIQYEVEFW